MSPPSSPFRVFASLCLVLLVLGVGCRSQDFAVSTTIDPLTAFPPQATYVWDLSKSHAPTDQRLAHLELTKNIQEQTQAALAAHGYRLIAEGQPDYRLSYQLTVLPIVGANVDRAVGTLWLTLRERATDRSVWTGAVKADLYVGQTASERHKRFRKMLDAMFKDFPPEQRGN